MSTLPRNLYCFKRVNDQLDKPLDELVSKLKAGSHSRCPGCFRWIVWQQVAAMATYAPDGSNTVIPYVCCKRCMKKAFSSPLQWEAMHTRIGQYLSGPANQQAVGK